MRLKDKDGRLIDYRDTAATERMRGRLVEINEALKRVRVDLDTPQCGPGGRCHPLW